MAKKPNPIKDAGLEIKLNTPVGIGQYAYLETPDFEFNSAGDWKVKVFFDPTDEAVQKMMVTLDNLQEKALEYFTAEATTKKAKAKVRASENTPYYFETNDEDDLTGRIYINPKSIASGKTKEGEEWKRQMPIFDATGGRVTQKLNIGSGTTMRVSLILRAYFNVQNGVGISLRLTAVQIIDLKQFGGGIQTAADAGFTAVEGGFDVEGFESLPADAEPTEPQDEEGSEPTESDASQY